MNSRLLTGIKYIFSFVVLSALFFKFSDRFDSKKSRFSKIDYVFTKNESDDFKKVEFLSQEVEFLCRNSGHNHCAVFNFPTLRSFVPLLGGNTNQTINDTTLTDFYSDYTNNELLVSYVIENDLLNKNKSIQNSIEDIPQKIIIEQYEKYNLFLKNEKKFQENYKNLFTETDHKKKSLLILRNENKLDELTKLVKATPFMMLKEKKENLLFRKMSPFLRLILSGLLAVIVIFYINQLKKVFFNKQLNKES